MDDVTQQNAALVEEAAAAAGSLQDQAGNLTQVVSVFKLDGAQTAVAAAPSTEGSLQDQNRNLAPRGNVVKLNRTRVATSAVPAVARTSIGDKPASGVKKTSIKPKLAAAPARSPTPTTAFATGTGGADWEEF
jgi:methyl-accepting chemotaxis protein